MSSLISSKELQKGIIKFEFKASDKFLCLHMNFFFGEKDGINILKHAKEPLAVIKRDTT